MDTPQHFQIIDGTFTPEQARQILGAMVKSKIDFHTLEGHSSGERSGDPAHSSGERLHALRDLDGKLRALFESAKAAGKNLEVKGSIEITPVE